MDKPRDDKEETMRRLLRTLARIAGSVAGSLVGGVLGLVAVAFVVAGMANGNDDAGLAYSILLCPPGFLLGATMGAAVGATILHKVLRQRSSFWKALLGAIAGLLAGGLPTAFCLWALYDHGIWLDGLSALLVAIAVACASAATRAVIGSGWKVKSGGAVAAQS
jgi:hypothetical protein